MQTIAHTADVTSPPPGPPSPASSASAAPSTSPAPARLAALDRVRYRAGHEGLVLSLGAAVRLWHVLVGAQARVTVRDLQALRARFDDLLAADLANVEAGAYPRELLFSMPVRAYLGQLPAALVEGSRVYRRLRRRRHDELPADVDRERYPAYYLRNFHWQTDGWFSDRSARLYDGNVEALFGGTADVMRRMALPAIGRAAGRPGSRVLDVACGTGRLLAQTRVALPGARLYGLDLSPHYLARARRTLEGALDLSLVHENAEAMPFHDGLFDAVASTFLFHELPKDARRRVAGEMFRVAAPGAAVAVVDSAQRADGGPLAAHLDAFSRTYHEPYFKSYLEDPIEGFLAEAGFVDLEVTSRFVSKVVTGRKPG